MSAINNWIASNCMHSGLVNGKSGLYPIEYWCCSIVNPRNRVRLMVTLERLIIALLSWFIWQLFLFFGPNLRKPRKLLIFFAKTLVIFYDFIRAYVGSSAPKSKSVDQKNKYKWIKWNFVLKPGATGHSSGS